MDTRILHARMIERYVENAHFIRGILSGDDVLSHGLTAVSMKLAKPVVVDRSIVFAGAFDNKANVVGGLLQNYLIECSVLCSILLPETGIEWRELPVKMEIVLRWKGGSFDRITLEKELYVDENGRIYGGK